MPFDCSSSCSLLFYYFFPKDLTFRTHLSSLQLMLGHMVAAKVSPCIIIVQILFSDPLGSLDLLLVVLKIEFCLSRRGQYCTLLLVTNRLNFTESAISFFAGFLASNDVMNC